MIQTPCTALAVAGNLGLARGAAYVTRLRLPTFQFGKQSLPVRLDHCHHPPGFIRGQGVQSHDPEPASGRKGQGHTLEGNHRSTTGA